MNLDEAQKKQVSQWIGEGLKLSDIQKRLASELGVNFTYMEVRLLVDDLKLTPRDIEPAKTADLVQQNTSQKGAPKSSTPSGKLSTTPLEPAGQPGGLSLTVDTLARPGTVVSGKVTFSDQQSAEWYLDQTGRLGLMPTQQGYRPSQQDVLAFQAELQTELAKLGF